MNRIILFKAQTLNKIWVEGFYFYSESEDKHYIIGDSIDYGFKKMEVIPETVGQYTGLKDKNGVKIFEGDIIAAKLNPRYCARVCWKGGPDGICKVFWDLNAFRLQFIGIEDKRYADFWDVDELENEINFVDLNLDHCEVIGNIHDNPELLEVKP